MEHRPFTRADMGWLVSRHAELYAQEAGFGPDFADAVRAVADHIIARADPTEAAWIAWSGGVRQGSLFLTRSGKDARLRLFLLEPEARGQGHGRDLLQLAMRTARAAGFDAIHVSTYDRHVAACRLYAAAGFDETGQFPTRAHGQNMVERHFSRPL